MMPRILLIEDDPDIRNVLKWHLIKNEFQVICAENVSLSLHRATEFQPDLIILDTNMPGIDGFQFAECLRRDSNCAHIPILGVTPFATYNRRLRAAAAGLDRFITKPYFLKDLMPMVKSMIA